MKFSRRAKFALGIALLLTLGVKAVFTRSAPRADRQVFAERASRLLGSQGFLTRLEHRPFGIIIYASTDACRLMLADYPPHGTLAEPLSLLARQVGPLRYVWEGKVLKAAPKLIPLGAFLLQRELRRIGLRPARRPLIAVAGSPGCDLQLIDWQKLETLPA